MTRLAEFGPWALALGAALLLRKEIAQILHAPKNDRGMEEAFKVFGEQLGRNLVLFEKTNQHLESIEERLGIGNGMLQQVLTELVRGRR